VEYTGRQWPYDRIIMRAGVTEEVRNIGRKVRATRDEEVKKRREIQRVDDDEPSGLLTATTTVAGGEVELRAPTKKRSKDNINNAKKKAPPRKRPRRSLHRREVVEDKNVDRWMPSTDLLLAAQHVEPSSTPTSTGRPSSVVQMHGLPIGVTAGQIRKFFSGLNIHRLIVLPRHDFAVRELDTMATTDLPRKPGLRIERHAPSALRLLVKFDSAPAAALAVQRSGEVMPLLCSNTDDDNDQVVQGAAVCLTLVPKPYATVLLATLAIDCPLNYASPMVQFLQTLVDNEKLAATIVSAILWTEAIQRLHLTTTRPSLPSKVTYPIFPRRRKVSFQLSSDQVALLLRERRDELQRILWQVRNQLPFPSADVIDPTITDPALTLHTTCAKLLQEEIERADRYALIASKWKPLHDVAA
jgi:hypothetical protein